MFFVNWFIGSWVDLRWYSLFLNSVCKKTPGFLANTIYLVIVTISDVSEISVPTNDTDKVSALLKADDLAFGLLGCT